LAKPYCALIIRKRSRVYLVSVLFALKFQGDKDLMAIGRLRIFKR
jgi:hypothetical protein